MNFIEKHCPFSYYCILRLIWTVALLTPACLISKDHRHELLHIDKSTVFLCAASGIFLKGSIKKSRYKHLYYNIRKHYHRTF